VEDGEKAVNQQQAPNANDKATKEKGKGGDSKGEWKGVGTNQRIKEPINYIPGSSGRQKSNK
jgi:hypothetical protein